MPTTPLSHPIVWFYGAAWFAWLLRIARMLSIQARTPVVSPDGKPSASPFLSVVIPAKNEEKNIGACLATLKAQTYPHFELVVINDNSTDRTGEIIRSAGVTPIQGRPVLEGWTGKNHAIYCGVPHAKGEWLLFTDADTRHEPTAIAAVLAHAERHNLDLLTLLPRCLADSFWESLIQPIAMGYLGLWFPMDRTNDPRSPEHFANGQFLMMRRSLYEKIGGHEKVAGAFLEDYALMKAAKGLNARVQVAFGHRVYGTRMYDSMDSIWRGWRRIYQHAFESRFWILLASALCVLTFSVAPFVLLAASAWSLLGAGLLLVIIGVSIVAHRLVKAKARYALLHPLASLVVALILLDAARMAATRAKTVWR